MSGERPRLVMTLLVRDEADIVALNVAWHLAQGVNHVIATDNGSTDGTADALRPFVRRGVLTLLNEPSTAYLQDVWATRMALMARDAFGAEWVFCNDADEFWRSPTGDLRDMLPDESDAAGILTCRRHNMIGPRDALGTGPFYDVLTCRADPPPPLPTGERTEAALLGPGPEAPYFYHALPPKLLLRTRGLQSVGRGAHSAGYDGTPPASRPVPIRIYHYPIRGRDMFERSVRRIGQAVRAAPEIPIGTSWKYRRWLAMTEATGTIWPAFRETLPGRARLRADLEAGRVRRDPTMVEALRRLDVPAPEAAPPRTGAERGAVPAPGDADGGRLILIAGAPAGGGEALADLLVRRGATPPRWRLAAETSEPDRIGAVHAAILAETGTGPDDPRPVPPGWFDTDAARHHRQTLLEMLIADFADLNDAVIADPAASRLLPLWRALAEEQGMDLTIFIPMRAPLDMAGGLRRDRGLPIAHGLHLWLRHVLDAETSSRGVRRCIVSHADLLSDPEGMCATLKAVCRPSWPRAHAEIDTRNVSTPSGTGHAAASEAEMMASPRIPDAVKEIHEALAALRSGAEIDGLAPTFDRVAAQMAETAPLPEPPAAPRSRPARNVVDDTDPWDRPAAPAAPDEPATPDRSLRQAVERWLGRTGR
ncbi:glycosyl transferase family 2 [Palleronia aestuarii]|uniref:Glycosyl transferase family 2 n=1 Tax=Palleronia aestuarii TaxID=568105 RepID=A0A2W7N821_9RHOB|nr:glycosyltransferase family 2 protein [Palleronia aestuarii]PZX14347.1 glycosyl transferase family 2 [Palleronia aestuarii]